MNRHRTPAQEAWKRGKILRGLGRNADQRRQADRLEHIIHADITHMSEDNNNIGGGERE